MIMIIYISGSMFIKIIKYISYILDKIFFAQPEVRKALDEMEPKTGKGERFYREPPELKTRVDKLLQNAKHIQEPPKFNLGPVDPVTRLKAWHAAIGTPAAIAEKEIQELEKRLAAKGGSRK